MMRLRLRPFARACAALCVAASFPTAACGQAAWEYSPYQVRVWIVAAAEPQLPTAGQDELAVRLAARAEAIFKATWNVRVERPPAAIHGRLLDRLEITAENLQALAPDVLRGDKLIVVRLMRASGLWTVEARELDCRTFSWGHVAGREAACAAGLPLATWDAVAEAFTPIARIETVDKMQVAARLRAAGLVVSPASRILVEKGMALRPVIRRNDRTGQPVAKGGIQAVPWTLLDVEGRSDSLLTCRTFSGYRLAIPARGGTRIERLALLVRPRFSATTLTLKSRGAQPRPLVGYEIFSKRPDSEEPERLGKSDWRGQIELPRGDGAIRLLLVKNGTQLLARLPIVLGQSEQLQADLVDDEGRLQAEGAVAALHSRALDLVARREILAARFRARLKEQKFTEAQALLDEFRRLESRADLSRALDEQQQFVEASDPLTQQRIDKIFGEARRLLTVKGLADDMVNTLAAELVRARAGTQTTSAAPR
jgi:hypothetical protein